MFVNLNYNPQGKVWDYPGVENAIEQIRKYSGNEAADYQANLKWKDILYKLADGVYEFYDTNDPVFNDIDLKDCEFISIELAKELHFKFIDWHIERGDKEIYTSYLYGVCDNWEQIFKKIPEIKYYKDSKEQFVIFLCPQIKNEQPKINGWRWNKWGRYIGEQNPQSEYLYDEPEINKIYTFHISRVIKK